MGIKQQGLQATNLYRFYHNGDDETFALRGVSMELLLGETVVIIGPSGSGKSTLLHCLAGLDNPDGGTVTVLGQPMSRQPEAKRAALRGRSIGVLLQYANLFEHLTARENVMLAQAIVGTRAKADAEQLLTAVGIAPRQNARPSQLSGGELARAGLAVALANQPPHPVG